MEFKDFVRRSIKILNIGWASFAYLVLAIITVFLLDFLFSSSDTTAEETHSTPRLIFEITLHVWLIGLMTYIVRNLFPLVPWPFDGVYGYKHTRVTEVTNAALFASFLVYFNPRIQRQQAELRKRLFPSN